MSGYAWDVLNTGTGITYPTGDWLNSSSFPAIRPEYMDLFPNNFNYSGDYAGLGDYSTDFFNMNPNRTTNPVGTYNNPTSGLTDAEKLKLQQEKEAKEAERKLLEKQAKEAEYKKLHPEKAKPKAKEKPLLTTSEKFKWIGNGMWDSVKGMFCNEKGKADAGKIAIGVVAVVGIAALSAVASPVVLIGGAILSGVFAIGGAIKIIKNSNKAFNGKTRADQIKGCKEVGSGTFDVLTSIGDLAALKGLKAAKAATLLNKTDDILRTGNVIKNGIETAEHAIKAADKAEETAKVSRITLNMIKKHLGASDDIAAAKMALNDPEGLSKIVKTILQRDEDIDDILKIFKGSPEDIVKAVEKAEEVAQKSGEAILKARELAPHEAKALENILSELKIAADKKNTKEMTKLIEKLRKIGKDDPRYKEILGQIDEVVTKPVKISEKKLDKVVPELINFDDTFATMFKGNQEKINEYSKIIDILNNGIDNNNKAKLVEGLKKLRELTDTARGQQGYNTLDTFLANAEEAVRKGEKLEVLSAIFKNILPKKANPYAFGTYTTLLASSQVNSMNKADLEAAEKAKKESQLEKTSNKAEEDEMKALTKLAETYGIVADTNDDAKTLREKIEEAKKAEENQNRITELVERATKVNVTYQTDESIDDFEKRVHEAELKAAA